MDHFWVGLITGWITIGPIILMILAILHIATREDRD